MNTKSYSPLFIHISAQEARAQLIDLDVLCSHDTQGSEVEQNIHVIIEAGASVTILDTYLSSAVCIKRSVLYEVGRHAQVAVHHQYHAAPETQAYISTTLRAQEHSTISYGLLTTGGKKTEYAILLELIGAHATAQVQGVYMHCGHETVNFVTRQHHEAPHTCSKLTINGSLDDHAQMSFDGRILLGPAARYAQADQRNETFLLKPTAAARSEPIIEVLNNEVQCTHASAMGKLDVQQMAYLASRGLSFEQAQGVLLTGHLTKTVHNHALLAGVITAFQEQKRGL